jgi:DNA gyrase subunit A
VAVRADGTVGRAAGRLPAGAAAPRFVIEASTHCDLYLLNRRGQATRIGVHQLPDGTAASHADLGGLRRGDEIAAAFTAARPNGEPIEGYLVLATGKGAVKRVNLADLAAGAQANPNVIKLDENDTLAWAATSSGGGEILLVTAGGQVIRFAEDEVRPMGLPAGGIAGIKLQGEDRVVGGAVINAETRDKDLALLTAAGFGRRSPLRDFPAKGRGTQGVAAKLAAKSGPIVASLLLKPTDRLMVATSQGEPKPLAAKAIQHAARTAAGKVVLVLGAAQAVGAVLMPEGGGAPTAPKSNGAAAVEKPKRSVKVEAAAAKPKVAGAPEKARAAAEKPPEAPVKAAPAAVKAKAAPPKGEAAVEKPTAAPLKAAPAAAQTEAAPAKDAAADEPQAAPVRAAPAGTKTKAAAPKAAAAVEKPKEAPVKAVRAAAKTTAATPKAAAEKATPPQVKAAPVLAKTKAAAPKTAAAPAKPAPAGAKTKATAAKAQTAAKAAAPPPAKDLDMNAPTATRGKKPAELPRKPGPGVPESGEEVVSRLGKPGVLARPTVTESGQMLLVPPDPPADTPPKKPRKGTTK